MAASGPEMMLKALGMGPIIDMAKSLADSGAIDQILKFAQQAEQFNGRLLRIELALSAILQQLAANGQSSISPSVRIGADHGPRTFGAACIAADGGHSEHDTSIGKDRENDEFENGRLVTEYMRSLSHG